MSNIAQRRKRNKHIHKFIKIPNKSRTKFTWKCGQVDCAYALYPAQEEYLLKRESICWECESIFVMTEMSLTQNLPLCPECNDVAAPKMTVVSDGRALTDAEIFDEIMKMNKPEESTIKRIRELNNAK